MGSSFVYKILNYPSMKLDSKNSHVCLKVIIVQVLCEMRIVNEVRIKQFSRGMEESREFLIWLHIRFFKFHIFKDNADSL